MRNRKAMARTLLLSLLAALWLVGPATAWRMHEAGHGFVRVAAPAPVAKAKSCADCAHSEDGHDHLTSVMAAMSAIIPEADFEPVLVETPAIHQPVSVRRLAGTADPPKPKPPRFA